MNALWIVPAANSLSIETTGKKEAPRPKTMFEPGEVIRVCDGPFNDFNGVVEEVDYERNSVKVSVQILGRSTSVQLNFMQIEKT